MIVELPFVAKAQCFVNHLHGLLQIADVILVVICPAKKETALGRQLLLGDAFLGNNETTFRMMLNPAVCVNASSCDRQT